MKLALAAYRGLNILGKILFIVSLCVFVCSSGILAHKFIDDYRSKALYESIRKVYNPAVQETSGSNNYISSDQLELTGNELLMKMVHERNVQIREANERMQAFKSLQKINRDTVGYIIIGNTDINYPVVQYGDNSFYLTHDYEKRTNSHGTIFVDSGDNVKPSANLSGQNIILYGHYMKDGSMFAGLKSFRLKSFFENNPVIEFDILGKKHNWEVFSEYIADADFDYRQTSFNNASQFNDFLRSIKSASRQYRELNLTYKDTILTLSTCAYDFDNARLVIHAKLID